MKTVNIATVLVREDRQEAAKAGLSAFGSHFLAQRLGAFSTHTLALHVSQCGRHLWLFVDSIDLCHLLRHCRAQWRQRGHGH